MSLIHIGWLKNAGHFNSACGRSVPIFELCHDIADQVKMSAWAGHFRRHYCSDDDLKYIKPSNVSSFDYLVEIKFPSKTKKPGPSVRSGDFAEILVADYMQYLRGYDVPRTRWDRKIISNESAKGSDVVGFKWNNSSPNSNDQLLVYEIKALASEKSKAKVLQKAVDDSAKDDIRLAETLNAMRQRLGDKRDIQGVTTIARFQNYSDHPYEKAYGAAAVVSTSSFNLTGLASTTADAHPYKNKIEMLVIRGDSLITLIDALYERGANEA